MNRRLTEMKRRRHAADFMSAPQELRTKQGTGTLRIGGEFATDYLYRYHDDGGGRRRYDAGWQGNNTNLRFQVNATRQTYAYIKLNLLQKTSDPHTDDLVEEARIVWDQIAGGPWGMVFGKGEVPYGQDRTLGIIQSYHHNDGTESAEGPTILTRPHDRIDPLDIAAAGERVGRTAHPGEVDNVWMGGVNFTWRDQLKLEFALFSNTDGGGEGVMLEGKSDDFGVESFAARAWWNTPVDGLVTEVSFIREHSRVRGDRDRFGQAAVEAQYALSCGFTWDLPGTPWEFFGEYQHGWDWNYTRGYHTNTLQLGAIYEITPRFHFGLMGEWLGIEDRGEHDDYQRIVGSAKYRFENGPYVILEYGYEMLDAGEADAHAFGLRTGWSF